MAKEVLLAASTATQGRGVQCKPRERAETLEMGTQDVLWRRGHGPAMGTGLGAACPWLWSAREMQGWELRRNGFRGRKRMYPIHLKHAPQGNLGCNIVTDW